MKRLPKRIKVGQHYYNPSDFNADVLDLYLKYEFAARREREVKQYLSILTGHKTLLAMELKKEILSSKGGFDISTDD